MDTPKPNASMFARKGFEKLGEEAEKGAEALKSLTESMPQNKEQGPRKPPFVRREHLTQRPFNDPKLHTLRGGLDRGVKIKKK